MDEDAEWFLYTAVSRDATGPNATFEIDQPDPELVHTGPMNRKLLDFLQVDIGPDGGVHVAYAQDRGGEPDEATMYLRSDALAQLAPTAYPNGPK